MAKESATLNVEGMSCSHCENSILKAVGALDGVDRVTVDLKGKKVNVDYETEKTTLEKIKDAIEDQGYDVQ